jgi:signal transduction histidine kinase
VLPVFRSSTVRYAFAVVVTVLAALLRAELTPLWGSALPLITFYPAIVASAWLGGFGPGLTTTLFSAAIAEYLWIEPAPTTLRMRFLADAVALTMFVAIGVFISVVTEALYRAQRRQALERAETEAQLRDIDRRKDDFLAVLSHELRTPLTTMIGWLRMLRSGQLDAGQTQRRLETVERSARSLARMIDDLLDISRVAAGKMVIDRQALSLAPIVDEVVDSLQADANAKGVTLEATLDAGVGTVLADRERMRQIVTNLVTNAVKYTAAGGRIDVRLIGANGVARIVVRDTGTGIERALLPHVFERFRQGDWRKAGVQRGLGLGLAIVREIVELHDGVVAVHSDGPGTGTTFTVTLPVTGAAPTAA